MQRGENEIELILSLEMVWGHQEIELHGWAQTVLRTICELKNVSSGY